MLRRQMSRLRFAISASDPNQNEKQIYNNQTMIAEFLVKVMIKNDAIIYSYLHLQD